MLLYFYERGASFKKGWEPMIYCIKTTLSDKQSENSFSPTTF